VCKGICILIFYVAAHRLVFLSAGISAVIKNLETVSDPSIKQAEKENRHKQANPGSPDNH